MIELLSARVDDVLAGAQACASTQDHRAAERRRTPELQRRTLAGRAALRLLAARALGVSPDDASALPIERTCLDCDEPHGRPTMDGLALSSSTSGDRVLAAVAAVDEASPHRLDLGVDVEVIPQQLWDGFDEYVLHPSERLGAPAVQSRQGVADRLALWTQKEAVLKATGRGLRVAPSTVHFGEETDARVPTDAGWRRAEGLSERASLGAISVRSLSLSTGVSAAVATSGEPRVRRWSLQRLTRSADACS